MKPFSAPLGESLTGLPLFFLTITGCATGFLLFGYDQGVANALLQNADFKKTFPTMFTNANLQGGVLSMFVIGAMFGSLTNSFIGNRIGRRPLLFAGAIGTLIGSALQTGSVNLGMFIFARLVNGYSVGILTSITPVYVAEISKAHIRGLMMSLELVFAATGLMTAFWIAYAFASNTSAFGWRGPLGIQIILIVVTIFSLFFAPESPRWLIEVGRVDEGAAVLERFHGKDYAEAAAFEIKEAIVLEHSTAKKGYAVAFESNSQCFRYRTILSLVVNFFQQATGVNMATYYAGAIFITAIKLAPHEASLALGGLGISGLAGCALGCFVLMEKLGRVRTMMLGSFLNCVGMSLLAAGICHIDKTAGSYAAATGLYLFITSFSMTWLPCGWIYGAEISALAVRNQAAALGSATQYIFNFLIVEVTPSGIASLGWKFYLPFAVSNAAMIPLLYFFFPEIAGLTLEGVDSLFANGTVTMRRSPNAPVVDVLHHRAGSVFEQQAYKTDGDSNDKGEA